MDSKHFHTDNHKEIRKKNDNNPRIMWGKYSENEFILTSKKWIGKRVVTDTDTELDKVQKPEKEIKIETIVSVIEIQRKRSTDSQNPGNTTMNLDSEFFSSKDNNKNYKEILFLDPAASFLFWLGGCD